MGGVSGLLHLIPRPQEDGALSAQLPGTKKPMGQVASEAEAPFMPGQEEFVGLREVKHATASCRCPSSASSLDVNIRRGRPDPEDNGKRCLKIPLHMLQGRGFVSSPAVRGLPFLKADASALGERGRATEADGKDPGRSHGAGPC
jgi:hypothetical protein